ncbi:MAG: CPBP family intramembrane glutamic endopeptidase [Candidatus Eisenbacteria bacterium]
MQNGETPYPSENKVPGAPDATAYVGRSPKPAAGAGGGSGLHPFLKVLFYIVGYFAVGVALSLVGAIAAGIVFGLGVVEPPEMFTAMGAMDASVMDIEALLEVMEPYLLHLVIGTGLFTIAYTWAYIHVVDRKRLRSLGLYMRPGWSLDFAKGGGLAVLVLGVIFAFSLIVGTISVEGFSRPAPEGTNVVAYLVGTLVAFLLVGFYEELMFRGYVLQRVNERAGRFVSILVASLLFAVLHGANPGADAFGIVNTTIIAVILSVLYFRTRSLWMPVGFHFAWNFFLGYVYSMPVSGLPIYGILNVVEVDPESRLTGGSYGPEAGLACTIALALWGVWLIWKRTGRTRED